MFDFPVLTSRLGVLWHREHLAVSMGDVRSDPRESLDGVELSESAEDSLLV